MLSAALALAGGIMLRAQESQEGAAGTASASEETKTSMVEQCKHMCAVQYNPESAESLLAWKAELKLTDDQVASLKTVEEKARADAKALLDPEQLNKLAEISKDMKPQSMMQLMQGMMPGKEMMHGKGMMHGMKENMGKAMPMCCVPTQGEKPHH